MTIFGIPVWDLISGIVIFIVSAAMLAWNGNLAVDERRKK
jgi:hypothetical protein